MSKVEFKHFCLMCKSGRIDIPHWYEDVEGWGVLSVPCPVCEGKWALGIDEWNTRYTALAEPGDTQLQILRGTAFLLGANMTITFVNDDDATATPVSGEATT